MYWWYGDVNQKLLPRHSASYGTKDISRKTCSGRITKNATQSHNQCSDLTIFLPQSFFHFSSTFSSITISINNTQSSSSMSISLKLAHSILQFGSYTISQI